MIRFDARLKVMVALSPCDFRNGIDGIARLCEDILQADPRSGYLFVFRNKASTSAKMLYYDGRAYWLCQVRLSSGSFRVWPRAKTRDQTQISMMTSELELLFGNGSATTQAPIWQRIVQPKTQDVEGHGRQKSRTFTHRYERTRTSRPGRAP